MHIYAMTGAPTSGKTTFVKMVSKYCLTNCCYDLSAVDFVKDVAEYCGWNGEKTPENRKFLSDLKDLLTEWNDVPMTRVEEKINWIYREWNNIWEMDENDIVIFVQCRETKDIERLKDKYDAKSIIVRNNNAEQNRQSNHADNVNYDYDYDIIINNQGTLESLDELAMNFMKNENIKIYNWK